jgi:hypothetical protein
MKILRKPGDYNVILNQENLFQTNLGWEEGMDIFEDEVLSTIINPIDNYETIRYIHEPYNAVINGTTVNQCDIWFKFFFIDANTSYNNGLDYSLIGISPKDNANMIKTSTESYFRLEFFKTPNNEPPTRMNRKLVFSKNLQLPIGEKFYYNTLRQNIHVPVFMGSNYRNKENMYLFWFQDDTVLSDSTLSGDTFFMTANFLNANDGSIIDFTNSRLLTTTEISESADLYYKVVINKSGYTYNVYNYDGTQNERVGNGLSNSINFYEKGGESTLAPTPPASPAPTPPASPEPTPAASPAPTPEPSPGGGGGSPSYNVSVNRTSIDETGPNNSVTVTVNTTNVANGTTLYWALTTSSNIILTLPPVSDFSGETYNLVINNNQGSFTLTAIEDFRTEGPATSETFAIEIKTGNTAGPVVGTTPLLSLNDTSKDPEIFTYYDIKNCTAGTTGLVMRYPGPDNLSAGVYVVANTTFNPQQAGIIYKVLGVSTQTEFTVYYGGEESAPEGGC